MKNGFLIAFEGGEGCGKTAQLHRLSTDLIDAGKPTLLTREPGGTEEGEKLWRMLINGDVEAWGAMSEFLLITASRVQHVNKIIWPALEMGQIVLCDRFVGSTLAYQGAAGGVPTDVILTMHEQATDGLWPDLTVVLDIDPAIGLERARERARKAGQQVDRFECRALPFHQQVRESFLAQAAEAPDRHVVIDAGRSEDEIYRDIRAAVFQKIEECAPLH